MISELVGEVIFHFGVLVITLGWTTVGETMVAIGGLGLQSWPVRAWRVRQQRACATSASTEPHAKPPSPLT
jgi:hypothetical protein